jgi:hypothetical protein
MSPATAEAKNVEHIAALIFTMIGGIFWIVTALVGSDIGGTTPVGAFVSIGGAFAPLIYTLAVLVIGYFQERIAALILLLGAVGTIVWGIIATWPAGVWAIMAVFFISPTIISMVLFWMAGRKVVEPAASAA